MLTHRSIGAATRRLRYCRHPRDDDDLRRAQQRRAVEAGCFQPSAPRPTLAHSHLQVEGVGWQGQLQQLEAVGGSPLRAAAAAAEVAQQRPLQVWHLEQPSRVRARKRHCLQQALRHHRCLQWGARSLRRRVPALEGQAQVQRGPDQGESRHFDPCLQKQRRARQAAAAMRPSC